MNIAIAGYGVEGKASYEYYAQHGHFVTIVDERPVIENLPVDVPAILGEGAFGKLNGFDMVVRTPGLSPRKIVTDGTRWSATNEFFAQCPVQIIGVTGSKGKGTTASLIAAILEAAGRKVWLLGNIGMPALTALEDIKPDDLVVYELSSFQLWDLEKSPHSAVVLHIEREHLNVHDGMDDYVDAKANITRHQCENCRVIYNNKNEYAKQIADLSKGGKVAYPSQQHAHIRDDAFYYGSKKICSVQALEIRGEHNKSNALAAIDAVWEYTQDAAVIEKGLGAFEGLPHRLAFVRDVHGVEYYDDSIATTPSSAMAALRAFSPEAHKVIILGGSSKGSDFSELARELTVHKSYVLLVGEEAAHIEDALKSEGYESYERADNATMRSLVVRAQQMSEEGGVVLLSPAAASFGQYKDYADRGNQFIEAVNEL